VYVRSFIGTIPLLQEKTKKRNENPSPSLPPLPTHPLLPPFKGGGVGGEGGAEGRAGNGLQINSWVDQHGQSTFCVVPSGL